VTKRIMVIDDSAALRQTVVDALVDAGYTVIGAADGREALGMLDGSKVDLMICDVHMPRMDGLTFVKEVKQLAGYRFVPIIMLTTESSEKSRLAGLMAGAKAWVVKPFRPEQILHAVAKLVVRGDPS
jgi:two-component system, chemotaxis family, chemotaxis protein CheY